MHLTLPWSSPKHAPNALPEITRSIGATEYRTEDAELLAAGRGPVREQRTVPLEVEPFPDRFDAVYGRHYRWHLLRDREGRYFLLVNRRHIKPIGSLEAVCRWVSATRVFAADPGVVGAGRYRR